MCHNLGTVPAVTGSFLTSGLVVFVVELRVWTPTRFLGELDETARWKHSLDGPKVLMIFYNFLT